jgi:hypothetical protein
MEEQERLDAEEATNYRRVCRDLVIFPALSLLKVGTRIPTSSACAYTHTMPVGGGELVRWSPAGCANDFLDLLQINLNFVHNIERM